MLNMSLAQYQCSKLPNKDIRQYNDGVTMRYYNGSHKMLLNYRGGDSCPICHACKGMCLFDYVGSGMREMSRRESYNVSGQD